MSRKHRPLTLDDAEGLAAQAFAFLAEDAARLSRFLALTGLTLDQIRAQAHQTDFLAGVVEHIAADESLLLVFSANACVAPEAVTSALGVLQDANRAAASS